MTKQVIVGFATEGPTDVRFLGSIIQRTFEEVAFECKGAVEVLPVQYLEKKTGSFVETMSVYAEKAVERGVMVLCIHTDADAANDNNAFKYKITPAFKSIQESDDELCKNLVAVVPVRVTEAWMLAELEILKSEIGTSKGDSELCLDKVPESYAVPKQVIIEAIRLAHADFPTRRRRKLVIGKLYQPLGQKIPIEALERLASYRKFKAAVREAYRQLNYLH